MIQHFLQLFKTYLYLLRIHSLFLGNQFAFEAPTYLPEIKSQVQLVILISLNVHSCVKMKPKVSKDTPAVMISSSHLESYTLIDR